MKYICKSNHIFSHLANRTEYDFNQIPYIMAQNIKFIHPGDSVVVAKTEIPVCPICGNLEYSEYTETVEDVESVYIYDLTSGPQTELNGLLAQGYKILNRYSKQYHLEKPKAKPEQKDLFKEGVEATQQIAESTFDITAKEAYAKLDEAKQP